MRPAATLMGALLLSGCAQFGSVADTVATAGIAAAVGSATNPVIGLIAGVAVSFAVDEGVEYAHRRIHGNVQSAIARAAGPLEEGEAAPWAVEEALPLTRRRGTVQIARRFGAAIPCKDVVFTVDDEPEFHVTTICRNGAGTWRWALAEPSVGRWGELQ